LASVWRDRARKALADDAEQLQMEINESIGNAIVTGVDLRSLTHQPPRRDGQRDMRVADRFGCQ
jgi:hypothetical protein